LANESLEFKVAQRNTELVHMNQKLTEHMTELQNLNQRQEALLTEIHHRVKNNLQIICSLLNLQSSKIKDTNITTIFQDSQNRIQAMALIHEILYQSSSLERIDFQVYIHSISKYIFTSLNIPGQHINLVMDIEPIHLDLEQAIPCGLILNELVTNAIKHAFPGQKQGEIKIVFARCLPDHYQLLIQDNGVSISHAWHPDDSVSLGLPLVYELIGQLQGEVVLERNQGTKFTITFPHAHTPVSVPSSP
jgi:two-component sensor histidine kinase